MAIIDITSKKECANQINLLWRKHFSSDEYLVYSDDVIKKELIKIHTDPNFSSLRELIDTIERWEAIHPDKARGRGKIVFNEDKDVANTQKRVEFKEKLKWVILNRLLFEKVSGFKDAARLLGIDLGFELIEKGKLVKQDLSQLEEIPTDPKSEIYRYSLANGNLALWQSYADFKKNQSPENWVRLKNFIFPLYANNSSISLWQHVERQAELRDGYAGARYAGKNVPTSFEVESALRFLISQKTNRPNYFNNSIGIFPGNHEKTGFSESEDDHKPTL